VKEEKRKRERGKEEKRKRGKEEKRERGKEGKRERGKEGKRERGKLTAASATVNKIQNLCQQMISGDFFEFVGEKIHKVLVIEGENECKDQSRSSKPK